MASFAKNLTFWLFRVREMLRVRRKRRERVIMRVKSSTRELAPAVVDD